MSPRYMKKSSPSALAESSAFQALISLTSESPDHAKCVAAGAIGRGGVLNVPISLMTDPQLQRSGDQGVDL